MISFCVDFTVEATYDRCQGARGFRRHRCPEALPLAERACWGLLELILCAKAHAGPVSWALDDRRPGRLVQREACPRR